MQQTIIATFFWLGLGGWLLSIFVTKMRRREGPLWRIESSFYQPIDFGIVIGICSLAIYSAIHGIVTEIANRDLLLPRPKPLTVPEVEWMMLIYAGMCGLIALYFRIRRIPLVEALGFRREGRRTLRRALIAMGLLLPILFATMQVLTYFFPDLEQQDIVKAVNDSIQRRDYPLLVCEGIMACVVAPFAEEFLFRGFFHGVMRKYLGPVASLLFVSLLFGAVHGNVRGLLPLSMVGFAMGLAYEITGNLAVSMTMHALFNTANFLLMFLVANSGPDVPNV